MRNLFLFVFFLQFAGTDFSQNFVLSGRVSHKNEALPFATILVKGSTRATNSNAEGFYTLKLPPGKYEIVYQYIGYAKHQEIVILNGDAVLNIDLHPDGISLKEIDVTAGEDPANPIIRKCIKMRKYYLTQVPAYSSKAYIKGLQKIKAVPKNLKTLIKLFGGQLSDTSDIKGVIYLSESESQYFYRAPSDEKEIMYSSKVSGDNKSFSFNKLSDMKLNFYNNLVEMGNLSNRPFVSPINENAFLFYRYYLQGTINGDGKTIHKIKVVPKRKTDACFSGMVYVQDSTWRITSVDLMLTKEVKIAFVDTLYIKQLHAPVLRDSVWMPVALNFAFEFKAFGFKGGGYFNANISDYDLNPVYKKEFFKNEVLVVEEGSNKKDSVYWSQHRAVPLTNEEVKDYKEKDSITKVRDTDQYKDSVDRVTNRLKLRDVFLGYRYAKTKKNLQVTVPGLITNGVQYNTVEGLNLSYKFSVDKTYENFKQFNVSGRLRYGFSNQLWGGEIGYNHLLKPVKRTVAGMRVKSIAEQYNRQEPISPLVNSVYSLFLNENYMKLFRETGIEGYYATELVNGIFFSGTARYVQRDPLRNTSDVLFVDDPDKSFTSNDPLNPSDDRTQFVSNRAFTGEITFLLRFKQKYYTLPQQKIITGSKYPRINISYKKAIPIFNSVVDYDLVSASISDAIKLGLFGRLSYNLKSGYFLNNKNLFFMDFRHFMGNQTIINTNNDLSSFRLLPYYTFSTDNYFTEFHAEHHFQGLLLGQLPLLKKLTAQEVAGIHFLNNNKLNYYYEINFGLEKIFRVLRLDYVLAYSSGLKFRQGFTISLNLNF